MQVPVLHQKLDAMRLGRDRIIDALADDFELEADRAAQRAAGLGAGARQRQRRRRPVERPGHEDRAVRRKLGFGTYWGIRWMNYFAAP